MMSQKHVGSDFDDFLHEEGLLEEAETEATKRVIAFQIGQEAERAHSSQSEITLEREEAAVMRNVCAAESQLDAGMGIPHEVEKRLRERYLK